LKSFGLHEEKWGQRNTRKEDVSVEEKLVDVKEIAAILGCSYWNIYKKLRRRSANSIPAYKVDGVWRFNVEEVKAWARNQRWE